MKIAIVGNGAIGNVLALHCEQQFIDYRLLTRHGQALNLSLTSLEGQQFHVQPRVSRLEHCIQPDLLILPLKAYQIRSALNTLRPTLNEEVPVLLLHNGMGTAEQARAVLPANPLLAATTSYGAFKPDHLSCIETGHGHTHMGWIGPPHSEHQNNLHTLLNRLLPPCQWHDDIHQALWQKVAVNAVINPLTAIHQIKNGALAAPPFASQIAAICEETASTMQACGYAADSQQLIALCHQVIKDTAENYSSMNRDVHHGRVSEIDYINGYIVRMAKVHGIQVPQNETLWQQISDRDKALTD